VEKRLPELQFKRSDRMTDRRLGDELFARRSSKAQVRSRGAKCSQKVQRKTRMSSHARFSWLQRKIIA
jgi:hypothetical protein